MESGRVGYSRMGPYATKEDYEACRELHAHFGTTYYFASQWFPAKIRRRVNALYAFVRVPDEMVDNPGTNSLDQQRAQLANYRAELLAGIDGVRPESPVLRAFCDTVQECQIPMQEPIEFLDAMEQDLTVARYETFEDLLGYTKGSAAAVGAMMCYVVGAETQEATISAAKSLGDAMQMTNFLRDVGEDAGRGRIYLPLEDLRQFGVSEDDILAGKMTPQFVDLMRFQIDRTRQLYARADLGIPALPARSRLPVRLARALYSKILEKIEERGYDVFSGRARTTKAEKLKMAALILAGGR